MAGEFDDDDLSSGFIIDNHVGEVPEDFKKVPCVGIRMVKDEVWITSDLKVLKKFKRSAFGDLNLNDMKVIGEILAALRSGGVKSVEENFLRSRSKSKKARSSNKK